MKTKTKIKECRCPLCGQPVGMIWAQSVSGTPTNQMLAWHSIELADAKGHPTGFSISCPASNEPLRSKRDGATT